MTDKTEDDAGFFLDTENGVRFLKAFTGALSDAQQRTVDQYIAPENMHRLRHGASWSHPARPDIPQTHMQQHSVQLETPFQSVVDNDLSLIARSIRELAESMGRQFEHSLFTVVAETSNRVGNVVDARQSGSAIEAFIQMLEKIEFPCDRFGQVSLPEMRLGSEAFAKFQAEFAQVTAEQSARIEAIKERKSRAATERESQRKARFVRYGEAA